VRLMDCQQYMARLSDVIDGRADSDVVVEMAAHRAECSRCRGYSRTLEAGRELLRGLPALEVPDDFKPRLDHRILHEEDGGAISRTGLSTGASLTAIMSVAVLVAAAAWAPSLASRTPSVDLPPVVVAGPSSPAFTSRNPPPTFRKTLSIFSTTEFQEGIWGNPHVLLREYSPILDRRRNQPLVRTGIE